MTKPGTRHACCTIAGALLIASGGCGGSQTPPPEASGQSRAAGAERPDFGGDFSLTNQDGQPFHLQDARGKVALLFFGYTSCPDMCPTTMSRIVSALDRVGDKRTHVVTLFVSVDPRRDTPAALKEYVASFHTPLVGLTGTPDEIAAVAAKYHATYQFVQGDSPNYLINHTTAIFLIDQQGQLRRYFAYNETPERLAAAIGDLLKGS
jgi:protein SCO1/2